MSDAQLQVIAVQVASNPAGATYLDQAQWRNCSSIGSSPDPTDANSAPNMPQTWHLSRAAVSMLSERLRDAAHSAAVRENEGHAAPAGDFTQSRTSRRALQPANIVKRTNFRYAKPATEENDAAKEGSEGAAQ